MKNINKYQTLADYSSDINRPTNENTVSYIKDEEKIIRNEVNVIVEVNFCEVGDVVVWDTVDLVTKVVKYESMDRTILPSRYIISGVVAYRDTSKILFYALEEISAQWAHRWEASIDGITLTEGTKFKVKINAWITDEIEIEAGETMTTLAIKTRDAIRLIIQTEPGQWGVTAYSDYLLVHHNSYTPPVTLFEVEDDIFETTVYTGNYLTTLTGFNQAYTSISRNDGLASSYGGAIWSRFYEYYRDSGSTTTNQAVGAEAPVRESVFNETDNPIIVAHYGTYENYLRGKSVRYPYSKNAILLSDGKGDTERLSEVTFINHLGIETKAYTAAAYTNNYTVPNTPFGQGEWYLESFKELLQCRSELLQGTSGITLANTDPLNKGLNKAGGTAIPANQNYWTSSEWSGNYSWLYYSDGRLNHGLRRNSYRVRPLYALPI